MSAISNFVKDTAHSMPANGKSIIANAKSMSAIGSFVTDNPHCMPANGNSITAGGSFETDGGDIILALAFANFEFQTADLIVLRTACAEYAFYI